MGWGALGLQRASSALLGCSWSSYSPRFFSLQSGVLSLPPLHCTLPWFLLDLQKGATRVRSPGLQACVCKGLG